MAQFSDVWKNLPLRSREKEATTEVDSLRQTPLLARYSHSNTEPSVR